jgi:hypothetical protein
VLGETVERRDESRSGGHSGVDLVGGEVVLEHDLDGGDAFHTGHGVVGVRHHQEGEVRRTEVRRQAQPYARRPVGLDRAGADESELDDRRVQLGIADRVEGGAHRLGINHGRPGTDASE